MSFHGKGDILLRPAAPVHHPIKNMIKGGLLIMTGIIVILFALAIGPYGWFWLAVYVLIALLAPNSSSANTDRDDWIPLKPPTDARSDAGDLDFGSYEWEQEGNDSFRNIKTGVTFTRNTFGHWTADDDDGSGNNSEYYGWYSVND